MTDCAHCREREQAVLAVAHRLRMHAKRVERNFGEGTKGAVELRKNAMTLERACKIGEKE